MPLEYCGALTLDGSGRYRGQESADVGKVVEVVVVVSVVVTVSTAVTDPQSVVLDQVRVERVLAAVEQLGHDHRRTRVPWRSK